VTTERTDLGRLRHADARVAASAPATPDQRKENDETKTVRHVPPAPTADRQTLATAPVRGRQTPKSLTAFSNLKKICDDHLKAAMTSRWLIAGAAPTFQRRPNPGHSHAGAQAAAAMRKIIGDLSDTERVLVGWICARRCTAGG